MNIKKPKLEDLKPSQWKQRHEGFFFKPETIDIGNPYLLKEFFSFLDHIEIKTSLKILIGP